MGEKGEGTSQDRQKEKGTRAVISEPIYSFPVMATTAERPAFPSPSFPHPPSWLGFHVLSLSYYFSQAAASPVTPPAVFKHCITWCEAAEPLGGKHWVRSQHEARAGKDPCPLLALQAALLKSGKKLTNC